MKTTIAIFVLKDGNSKLLFKDDDYVPHKLLDEGQSINDAIITLLGIEESPEWIELDPTPFAFSVQRNFLVFLENYPSEDTFQWKEIQGCSLEPSLISVLSSII